MVSAVLMGLLSACGGNSTPTPVPVATSTTAAASAASPTAMAVETSTVMMAVSPTAMTAETPTAGAMITGTTTASSTAVMTTTAQPVAAAPTPTAFPTIPQPSGSTKITFWYGLTGFNGGIVQQVINKFNQSQQKYYVEGIQQPNYDDTINKLNTSLAGGDLPNVVQIYDIGTQRMIDTKRIIPVQDFVDKDNQQALLDDLSRRCAATTR